MAGTENFYQYSTRHLILVGVAVVTFDLAAWWCAHCRHTHLPIDGLMIMGGM